MMSPTSSPSSGTGNVANGPMTELHEEKVVGVEIDLDRLLVARHRHHAVVGRRAHRALRAQMVEVRVGVLEQRLVAEEVDLVVVDHVPPIPPAGPALTAYAKRVLSIQDLCWAIAQHAPPEPMTSTRRIGTESSATRTALLDAAQQVLLEEGYAAATSRRVAARAGLKPQLVHYYFRTMDDLFLALVRRGAEQNLERQAEALASPEPLRALWELSSDPAASALDDRIRCAGQPPQGDPGGAGVVRRAVPPTADRSVDRDLRALRHRRPQLPARGDDRHHDEPLAGDGHGTAPRDDGWACRDA